MRTRFYLILLAALMAMALSAGPVMRTIINKQLYHASGSDTRCVTGSHDPTILETAITHLTLWDISNPVYPRQGITLSESNWWGYVGYRDATVYQNLLIYMDENYLTIMDISNIDIPVQVYHLRITQVYCLGVYEHYLVMGKQDGALDVYDLAMPSNLRFVGSFMAQPAVWKLRQSGDKLGVICGNYSNNTACLFAFSEADESFTEVASVTGAGRISHVGELAGKLILKYEQSGIHIYDYAASSPPALLYELPPSQDRNQVLSWADKMVSLSQDNWLRVWQLNELSEPVETAFFDLSHLNLEQGALLELKGERLLYMVGNLLCLELDIPDSAGSIEPVAKYENGDDLALLEVPKASDWLFTPSDQGLRSLKLDSSGMLSEGVQLPLDGQVQSFKAWETTLQILSGADGSLRMRSIKVQDPAHPVTVSDLQMESSDVFLRKNRYIYAGSYRDVTKYSLDVDGVPVWQKELSYGLLGYEVYFRDFVSTGGADYALGVFGSPFAGYYPILVWWLPGGETGHTILNDRVDKLQVLDQYLILSGDGIHIFRLNNKIPGIYRSYYKDNHHRGASCSIMAGRSYLIESYEVSNLICVYDLANPRNPQLVLEIPQPYCSRDLGCLGDKLLTANGIHGIAVYELPMLASIQEEIYDPDDPEVPDDPEDPEDPGDPEDPEDPGGDPVPPVPVLWVYPNPFKDGVNLRYELKVASDVSIEVFNIRGQKLHSQVLKAVPFGVHTAAWDGKDSLGQNSPAGVYIIRFQSKRGVYLKRISKID